MKLFGKNSVSTIISWLLIIIFIYFAFTLVLEILGFTVGLYNIKTNSKLFLDTFKIWEDSINPGKYYFKFYYPFTNHQFSIGALNISTFIQHFSSISFLSLFFFFGYKIFQSMSHERLFNVNVIKWLKLFSLLNIFYSLFFITFLSLIFKIFLVEAFISSFAFFSLGIMVFFIVAFFKKGFELQAENDLTI